VFFGERDLVALPVMVALLVSRSSCLNPLLEWLPEEAQQNATSRQPQMKRELTIVSNSLNSLEAATGFEPVNNGFADRCLATWLCRHGRRNNGMLECWTKLSHNPIIPVFRCSSVPAFHIGAGNGTRTRDNHVGNVGLYQLSYSRSTGFILLLQSPLSILFLECPCAALY
jgi:hypothetical protein